MAARDGYLGRAPGDSTVMVARQTFTPSGSTSDFTFNSGYVVGYLDVYLDGSRLIEGNEFSATDGGTITLTPAVGAGSTVEAIAYKAFNLGTTDTVTSASNNFTVGNNLTVGNDAQINNNITATRLGTFADANVSGACTATTFVGALTGNVTGNCSGTSASATGNAGGLTGTPDISVDLCAAADVQVSGSCTITGNLTVDGTQTIINTETYDVADKTVGIASTSTASDTTASGAGIEIYASSGTVSNNKTLKWSSTGYNWTFAKGGLVVSQGGLNVTGVSTFSAAGSFAGALTVSDSTSSTTKDTGCVIVEGGVGVEENLNVGGAAKITGITTLSGGANLGTGSSIFSPGSNILTLGTNSTEAARLTSTQGITLNNGELVERCYINTTAWSSDGTVNLDNGMVHLNTSNLGGTSNTLNITSSVGINTQMATGDVIAVTCITACNSTSSYINNITIDHSVAATENWAGGSAPTDGGGSGYDSYAFNIIKTGSGTYVVMANHTKTS